MNWLNPQKHDYSLEARDIEAIINEIPEKPQLVIQSKPRFFGLFKKKRVSIQEINQALSKIETGFVSINDRDIIILKKLEQVYSNIATLDEAYTKLISKTYKTAEGAQKTAVNVQEDSTNNLALVEQMGGEISNIKRNKASVEYVEEENRNLKKEIQKARLIAGVSIALSVLAVLLNVIGVF